MWSLGVRGRRAGWHKQGEGKREEGEVVTFDQKKEKEQEGYTGTQVWGKRGGPWGSRQARGKAEKGRAQGGPVARQREGAVDWRKDEDTEKVRNRTKPRELGWGVGGGL